MALNAERITVSTVAVPLNPADAGPVSGTRVVIRNTNATAADTLALGDSAVTAATGYLLPGGSSIELQLGPGDQVYAVRGAAVDVAVHVLRVG